MNKQAMKTLGEEYIETSSSLYNHLQKLQKKLKDPQTPVEELSSLEQRCTLLYTEYLYTRDKGNELINYYNNSSSNSSYSVSDNSVNIWG